MARGDPDPRANPAPVEDVPRLIAEGAERFNARDYWHAHESWEAAWHALRAGGEPSAAEFVQGMTIVSAGYENAARGKEAGFRRQVAKGLALLRANRGAATRLGVEDSAAWIEALTDAYLDAAGRVRLEELLATRPVVAPPVAVRAGR